MKTIARAVSVVSSTTWVAWALVVLLLCRSPGAVAADVAAQAVPSKIALVIGNASYASRPLQNAVSDARLISDSLTGIGFQVVLGTNLTKEGMYKLVDTFREKAELADVALIFYAGHGVQVNGKNYLIPVDLVPKSEDDIARRSVDMDRLVDVLNSERKRVNIMIVDACRDNPFSLSRSLVSKGLAEIQSKPGTLIAYSTSPGSTATDSAAPNGRNSIYSYALAEAMQTRDLPVEQAFKNVRKAVLRATANKQTPWEVTSLVVPFSFNGKSPILSQDKFPQTAQRERPVAPAARSAVDRSATTGEQDHYQSPEEARLELVKLGVPWTGEAFAESLKTGDVLTTKLFIRAGKNVFSKVGASAVIGYMVCGEERVKTLRLLRKLDIDLNTLYERTDRVSGLSLTGKSHIVHDWLLRCPADDVDYANELIRAGVKLPTNVLLEGNIGHWERSVWKMPAAMKVLLKGKVVDASTGDYKLFRELRNSKEPASNDDELIALVSPKDVGKWTASREVDAAKLNAANRKRSKEQEQASSTPMPSLSAPDSLAETMRTANSMAPMNEQKAGNTKAPSNNGAAQSDNALPVRSYAPDTSFGKPR